VTAGQCPISLKLDGLLSMVFGKVVPCSSGDIRQVPISWKLGGFLSMVFGKVVPCRSSDIRQVPISWKLGGLLAGPLTITYQPNQIS